MNNVIAYNLFHPALLAAMIRDWLIDWLTDWKLNYPALSTMAHGDKSHIHVGISNKTQRLSSFINPFWLIQLYICDYLIQIQVISLGTWVLGHKTNTVVVLVPWWCYLSIWCHQQRPALSIDIHCSSVQRHERGFRQCRRTVLIDVGIVHSQSLNMGWLSAAAHCLTRLNSITCQLELTWTGTSYHHHFGLIDMFTTSFSVALIRFLVQLLSISVHRPAGDVCWNMRDSIDANDLPTHQTQCFGDLVFVDGLSVC